MFLALEENLGIVSSFKGDFARDSSQHGHIKSGVAFFIREMLFLAFKLEIAMVAEEGIDLRWSLFLRDCVDHIDEDAIHLDEFGAAIKRVGLVFEDAIHLPFVEIKQEIRG